MQQAMTVVLGGRGARVVEERTLLLVIDPTASLAQAGFADLLAGARAEACAVPVQNRDRCRRHRREGRSRAAADQRPRARRSSRPQDAGRAEQGVPERVRRPAGRRGRTRGQTRAARDPPRHPRQRRRRRRPRGHGPHAEAGARAPQRRDARKPTSPTATGPRAPTSAGRAARSSPAATGRSSTCPGAGRSRCRSPTRSRPAATRRTRSAAWRRRRTAGSSSTHRRMPPRTAALSTARACSARETTSRPTRRTGTRACAPWHRRPCRAPSPTPRSAAIRRFAPW